MRHLVAMIAFGAAAAAASPALCQNLTPRPIPVQASPQAVNPLCECRAGGRVFIQGQTTCVYGQVAVCAMDQNVTTWRGTGQACPQS
jgi:hypothetical protein